MGVDQGRCDYCGAPDAPFGATFEAGDEDGERGYTVPYQLCFRCRQMLFTRDGIRGADRERWAAEIWPRVVAKRIERGREELLAGAAMIELLRLRE